MPITDVMQTKLVEAVFNSDWLYQAQAVAVAIRPHVEDLPGASGMAFLRPA